MPDTILFLEREPWEQEFLKGKINGAARYSPDTLEQISPSELKDVTALVTFIHSRITPAALARLPKLKLIATRSTGYDHIDLQACEQRGITVSNVPTYGENTVAEHTIALLLALARKLVPSIERTRRGDFRLDGLRGFDLKGKTIGVIGTGHIGLNVIRYCLSFGMTVIAFDPKPDQNLAQTMGFDYLTLDQLFRRADVISPHVPLLPATTHLLNDAAFKQMKRGVIILNTSRGGVIDTKALVRALKNGIVSAAGLDVLEEECEITEERDLLTDAFRQKCDLETILANHILLERENVIITPHNAFNSQEALERILTTTIANIKAFQAGQPINVVSAKTDRR